MAHLFIANGTHQVQHAYYRLPESNKLRMQPIAVGGQIRIDGDLTKAQIDSIIKQLSKYGIIPTDEIEKSKTPAPLTYKIDAAVTGLQIERLIARNHGVLTKVGQESRKNAALGLATVLGREVRDTRTGIDFEQAEVDIVEQPSRGVKVGEKVEETIIAHKEGTAPRRKGSRR